MAYKRRPLPGGIKIPFSLIMDKRLTSAEKILYAIIWHHKEKDGQCTLTNERLSELTGTETRTIQRNLANLEELNFLNREMLLDIRTNQYQRFLRPILELPRPEDESDEKCRPAVFKIIKSSLNLSQ